MMLATNPYKLSPKEKVLRNLINVFHSGSEKAVAERKAKLLSAVKANLQTAVEIELATLPIYLFSYYSINRTASNQCHPIPEPLKLFANKAGGKIMSVAVEEMLHLSLAGNVLFGMGQIPRVYGKSPSFLNGGVNLPHHKPKGPDGKDIAIDLRKFDAKSLWYFLEIEYPKQPEDRIATGGLAGLLGHIAEVTGREELIHLDPSHSVAEIFEQIVDAEILDKVFESLITFENWNTIGDFYAHIKGILASDFISDADFPGSPFYQISNDYYAQNCIDTIYPSKPFDSTAVPTADDSAAKAAVYPNQGDSNVGGIELTRVNSVQTAMNAINTICEQGEGFDPMGEPYDASPYSDPEKQQEQSHYYKFLKLLSEIDGYDSYKPYLPAHPPLPDNADEPWTEKELSQVIYAYAVNPRTEDYEKGVKQHSSTLVDLRPLSELCNAVYQYMLLMLEDTYQYEGAEQVELFNVGMHKAMIWVLDKLIGFMRGYTYGGEKHDRHVLAPTFEYVELLEAKINQSPKDVLLKKLAACGAFDLGDIATRIQELPDLNRLKVTPEVENSIHHACMGLNACKGQGLGGKNDCAGQGACFTSNVHSCHTLNDCKYQGGCGLYGTEKEQSRPGSNACKGHGSCATPINRERFATAGENQGKSVWQLARAALEDRMQLTLGQPPKEAFIDEDSSKEMVGPSAEYLKKVVKENNCGYNTCGASGMSGGGSCS